MTTDVEKSNLIDRLIDRESDRMIKTEQREVPDETQTQTNIKIDRQSVFCFQQLCNIGHPLISVKHGARFLHPSLQCSKATVINHSVEGQSLLTTGERVGLHVQTHTKLYSHASTIR